MSSKMMKGYIVEQTNKQRAYIITDWKQFVLSKVKLSGKINNILPLGFIFSVTYVTFVTYEQSLTTSGQETLVYNLLSNKRHDPGVLSYFKP